MSLLCVCPPADGVPPQPGAWPGARLCAAVPCHLCAPCHSRGPAAFLSAVPSLPRRGPNHKAISRAAPSGGGRLAQPQGRSSWCQQTSRRVPVTTAAGVHHNGPACQGRPPEGRLRRVSARAESPLQEFPFERGRIVAEEASGRRPRHRADVGGQGPSRQHVGRGTVSRGRRHRAPGAAPHFPTAARGLLAGPRVASDLEGPERMTARGCAAASQRPSFQRAPSRQGISNPPPQVCQGRPRRCHSPQGSGKAASCYLGCFSSPRAPCLWLETTHQVPGSS